MEKDVNPCRVLFYDSKLSASFFFFFFGIGIGTRYFFCFFLTSWKTKKVESNAVPINIILPDENYRRGHIKVFRYDHESFTVVW